MTDQRAEPVTAEEIQRFEDHCSKEPMSGCWLWTGSLREYAAEILSLRQKAEKLVAEARVVLTTHKCRCGSTECMFCCLRAALSAWEREATKEGKP